MLAQIHLCRTFTPLRHQDVLVGFDRGQGLLLTAGPGDGQLVDFLRSAKSEVKLTGRL